MVALAARPEVLLLDEPAAGLDPVARRWLLTGLVEALNRGDGCTVLFSTHLVGDLERVAEYVGMMDRGRVVTSARLEELLLTVRRVQVVFAQDSPPPDFRLPGALFSRAAGPVVTAIVRLAADSQLDPVRALPGVRVNVFPLSLEEIFIELFGRQERNELAEESALLSWLNPASTRGPTDLSGPEADNRFQRLN